MPGPWTASSNIGQKSSNLTSALADTAIVSKVSVELRDLVMLRIWRHPKTQEIRLYFAKKAIQDALDAIDASLPPGDIKAWACERNGHPEIKVIIQQEGTPDHRLKTDLRNSLQASAPFTANDTWDSVLTQAEDTEKRHAAAPTQPPQCPATDVSSSEQEEKRHKDRHYEAGRLKVEQIKMRHAITIEVDHRETKLIAELLSAHPMITVKQATLDLADFRVTDRAGNELLIERKRCTPESSKTDFEASILDSRLFDQSERLKFQVSNSDHQVIPIILLEGSAHANATSMLLKQVDGAISFLCAAQRISVLQSYNVNHSAYVIAKLSAHFIDGLYETPTFHRRKPKALFEQKRFLIEALPGVSTQIAEALLERFGSVQALANAPEGELARVKGIGAKRAREIRRVFGEP